MPPLGSLWVLLRPYSSGPYAFLWVLKGLCRSSRLLMGPYGSLFASMHLYGS